MPLDSIVSHLLQKSSLWRGRAECAAPLRCILPQIPKPLNDSGASHVCRYRFVALQAPGFALEPPAPPPRTGRSLEFGTCPNRRSDRVLCDTNGVVLQSTRTHPALKTFQLQVTLICGVWVAGGVLLLSAIAYRQLPSGLRYLISISDVSLLTAAALCGTKAESQLIFAYPILIVLSVLCFEARLVALTTVLSIAGYMTLVGQLDERWFDAEHAVPVFTQVFIVTSFLTVGCIGMLICRQVQSLAIWYSSSPRSTASSLR